MGLSWLELRLKPLSVVAVCFEAEPKHRAIHQAGMEFNHCGMQPTRLSRSLQAGYIHSDYRSSRQQDNSRLIRESVPPYEPTNTQKC
jgi:hypothetical protein